MDLIDVIDRLASRLDQHTEHLKTEEATKHTLVMPIINALGYNVFDALEVIPEFTSDVGTKKGEKVDYAVVIGGKPMILIECKTFGSKLSLNHASQLYRYFSVTEARFAVLTNGVEFWFYSDLQAPNKMDDKPFFEFDLRDYDAKSVDELKKFSKANFNLDNILSNASELKYAKQIEKLLAQELEEPSDEFVRLFTGRVYTGRFTTAVQEQFRALVRNAFRQFLHDQINDRLKSALRGSESSVSVVMNESTTSDGAGSTSPPAGDEGEESTGVVTTQDEIEGFYIVRAILSELIDPSRVVMRDTKSYCGILLDNNNRKPICRLRFNFSQKYISLLDAEKNEERIAIGSVHEIFKLANRFKACVRGYDRQPDILTAATNDEPTPANGDAASD